MTPRPPRSHARHQRRPPVARRRHVADARAHHRAQRAISSSYKPVSVICMRAPSWSRDVPASTRAIASRWGDPLGAILLTTSGAPRFSQTTDSCAVHARPAQTRCPTWVAAKNPAPAPTTCRSTRHRQPRRGSPQPAPKVPRTPTTPTTLATRGSTTCRRRRRVREERADRLVHRLVVQRDRQSGRLVQHAGQSPRRQAATQPARRSGEYDFDHLYRVGDGDVAGRVLAVAVVVVPVEDAARRPRAQVGQLGVGRYDPKPQYAVGGGAASGGNEPGKKSAVFASTTKSARSSPARSTPAPRRPRHVQCREGRR